TVIDGKYVVESVLGEGGMGLVYRMRDIHTHVEVVIKAIRAEYANRRDFRDRILSEGRVLARIDHPNVVRLNAVVVEPEAIYLVMQFIEGESLDKTIERHVAQRSPMPVQEVFRIFRQVLLGVGAAHREGIIHRDLKPANILIRTRDGVAKVTDFGIAKAEEDAQAGRGQTKGIIGSLLYMAPEQLLAQRDLDKRVDIYCLGILLFEMMMGHVPFDAPSEFEIMKLHLEAQVPLVSQVRRDVPPLVDQLIQRACAKDRANRYPSTEEFLAALDQGVADIERSARVGSTAAVPAPRAFSPARPVVPLPQTFDARELTEQQEPVSDDRRHWASALAIIVLLGAAGGAAGLAWNQGWLDFGAARPDRRPHRRPPGVSDAGPARTATESKPDAPAPSDPLDALAGQWVSSSGLRYDAVLVGGLLEFRLIDASRLRDQGYVDGESRFRLARLPEETHVFGVQDKIRPPPPIGKRYDLQQARATCQEIWFAVGQKALRARLDRSHSSPQLIVEMVKMQPSIDMYVYARGSKTEIVSCKDLRTSAVSVIETVYTKQ
ncbi:MAG: serine/threonine protein kinase, partial [Polyangiaceae bacterium]|nr:serine/threonine protein kinase [Polyangiaceae bacterium]